MMPSLMDISDLKPRTPSPGCSYWLVVGLLVICRLFTEPHWLFGGEMYAEMATNYYQNTINAHSLMGLLFATDAGYIPLLQRLIALAGWLFHIRVAAIPYFYTWSALLLMPMMLGIFVLKPFRALIAYDNTRFVVVVVSALSIDFTTRLFINFTYAAIFGMIVLCALALQKPEDFPGWCWPWLILALSKPYMLALLPIVVLIVLRTPVRRVKIFFGIFLLMLLIQMSSVAKHALLGTMAAEQSHDFSSIQMIGATIGYFFIMTGQFVLGGTIAQHVPPSATVLLFFIVGILVMVGIGITSRLKSQGYWLLWCCVVTIAGSMFLNCFALSLAWNIRFERATFFVMNRHSVTVFLACVLIVAAGIDSWTENRRLVFMNKLPVSLRTTSLFLIWFLLSGGAFSAKHACAEPSFPDVHVSEWQQMAPRMQAGQTPACVLLDPYGWVYGPGLKPNQAFPDLHYRFTYFSPGIEMEVEPPTSSIVALGVTALPFPGPTPVEVNIKFIIDTPVGKQTLDRRALLTGPHVYLAMSSRPITDIKHVWISFDHPVGLLTTGKPEKQPAMIYIPAPANDLQRSSLMTSM